MPTWGDGTKWGDGSKWSERPFAYPRGNHLSLTVRTSSGTDYVADSIDTRWRIESVLSQRISRAYFTFRLTSASAIDDHDEVIVLDQSQTRLFAGFVESFKAKPDGKEIEYSVVCVDYSWLLDHPVGQTWALGQGTIQSFDAGTADSAIIEAVLDVQCPQIDPTTYVSTIGTFTDRQYYENMNPRQILESICRRTGGEWYVDYEGAGDYKASLHYYAPGAADAPFTLIDDINLAPETAFPYGDLVKSREHATATRVIVEGKATLVTPTTRWLTGDGTKRLELPFRIVPKAGYSVPVVEVDSVDKPCANGAYGNNLGDAAPGGGVFEVLWYPEDKYLEFEDAPPGLLLTSVACGEWQDVTGTATDATGLAKYGRHITIHVKDNSIYDSTTAGLVATALLNRWKADQDTYTCVCWEHGLRAGQIITLTNVDLGVAAEDFTIQSIRGRGIGGDLWEYALTLGKYLPDTVDGMRDLQTVKLETREHSELWEGGSRPIYGQIMFGISGTVVVASPAAPVFICSVPDGITIEGVAAYADTAPTGAAIMMEVHISTDDGVSWSEAVGENINAGDKVDANVGTISISAVSLDDLLRFDVTQVGSTVAGADLTLSLRVRQ